MSADTLLLDFLREHNAPCPTCGYNLRGLTTSKCPECGVQIKLSVGFDRPFPHLWLWMTVLTAVSAGLGVATSILIKIEGMWPSFQHSVLFASTLYFFLAAIPLVIVFVITRWLFLKLPIGLQRALAIVVISINTCAIGWIIFFTLRGYW